MINAQGIIVKGVCGLYTFYALLRILSYTYSKTVGIQNVKSSKTIFLNCKG